MAKILSVCLSEETGTMKHAVPSGKLVADFGLEGDAHAGTERQVSLLCLSSIEKMKGKGFEVKPGIFAENLVVEGMRIEDVKAGHVFVFSSGAILQVTQIGKAFHTDNVIFRMLGASPLPKEGIFARVVKGGEVKAGDTIDL